MDLRPYQQNAVDEMFKRINTAGHYLLQLPTGMGKTVIFTHAIKQSGLKTMVIAHREELLTQAKDKLITGGIPADDIDIVLQSTPRQDAKVWVASTQTIIRSNRLAKVNPNLIVIDEAHHSVSATNKLVIDTFSNIPIFGFTATPTRISRKERKELQAIWGELIFQYSIRQAILDGWLSEIEYYTAVSDISLDNVTTVAGDFNLGQLSSTVNVPSRHQIAIDEYLQHDGGKAIAFCVNIEHAQAVAAAFTKNGIPARCVFGETETEERRAILNIFKKAPHCDNLVICNCMVLTEGFDCPNVRQILMMRPTKSEIVYVQSLGRGLRTAPDKKSCIVIDVVDNCSDPKLCNCLKTCFSLKSGLSGNITKQLERFGDGSGKDDKAKLPDHNIKMILKHLLFDTPLALERSPLQWFSTNENEFVCCLGKDESFLIIETALTATLYKNNIAIISGDLDVLANTATEIATKEHSDTSFLWHRSSRDAWDDKKATVAQIKYLKRVTGLSDDDLKNIPRGLASSILSAAFVRSSKELATGRQKWFLRRAGIVFPENLSKFDASKLIGGLKR